MSYLSCFLFYCLHQQTVLFDLMLVFKEQMWLSALVTLPRVEGSNLAKVIGGVRKGILCFRGCRKSFSMAPLRFLPLVLVMRRIASICILSKSAIPFPQVGSQAALAYSRCSKHNAMYAITELVQEPNSSLDHTQLWTMPNCVFWHLAVHLGDIY